MVGWVQDRKRPLLALLGLIIILAIFVSVGSRRVMSGAHDIGFLMVNTPDEFEIGRGIHGMYLNRTLDYNVPAYGGFYPGVSFLFTKHVVKRIGYTERKFALALRSFSLLAGVLAIAGVFWLTYSLSGSWGASVLGALFIAGCPEFMVWAVRIHPDTLLWFLLALTQGALALAVHRRSQRWLDASLVLIVLATMCKLAGIFFAPLYVIAQIYLDLVDPERGRLMLLKRLVLHSAKAAGIVVLVAYMTTPTLLVDSTTFFNNVRDVRKATEVGVTSGDMPLFGWLGALWDTALIGPTGTIILLAWILSFVPFVLKLLSSPRKHLETLSDRAALPLFPLLFAGGFLFYLLLSVRNYHIRYAAPVLPTAAVMVGLTAAGYFPHLPRIYQWLRARPLWQRAILPIVVLISLALECPVRHQQFNNDLRKLRALDRDPQLALAEWLDEHADETTSIVFDYNVYVPLRFKNAAVTYGLIDSQARDGAKYLVIHDKRRARFSDPNDARGDEDERASHMDRVETLAKLEANELYGYRRVKRFEKAFLTVYANTSSTTVQCPEECEPRK